MRWNTLTHENDIKDRKFPSTKSLKNGEGHITFKLTGHLSPHEVRNSSWIVMFSVYINIWLNLD